MCGLWLGAEEGNSGLLISFVFHVSLWPFLGWNPRDGSLLVPSQWRRNRHHFSNNDSFMKLGCLSQSLDAIIRHVFLPSLCRWLQLAADLWQPDSVCYLFWTKALNNWIGRPGKQIWYFRAQTTVCWVLLGECRGPLFNLVRFDSNMVIWFGFQPQSLSVYAQSLPKPPTITYWSLCTLSPLFSYSMAILSFPWLRGKGDTERWEVTMYRLWDFLIFCWEE